MPKPLRFKGDPKPKKRKRAAAEEQLPPTSSAAAAEEVPESDDTWLFPDAASDINGPIMLVLPTSPPTALASDAAGTIYRAKIENMVDGIASSAEPHNVQMVFVCAPVAGGLGGAVRFKNYDNKLLSCDAAGVLTANTEVQSAQTTFFFVAPPSEKPGTFLVKSQAGQYLVASKSKNAVSGDSSLEEDDLEATALTVRMQARFKPTIQAVKAEKAKEKVSRKELETAVGRRLDEDEVKKLKRARREGDYHEKVLDMKVKGKHDKYG